LAKIDETLDQVQSAIEKVRPEVAEHFEATKAFGEIGLSMLEQWEIGVECSRR
jgi:hypothetical protein